MIRMQSCAAASDIARSTVDATVVLSCVHGTRVNTYVPAATVYGPWVRMSNLACVNRRRKVGISSRHASAFRSSPFIVAGVVGGVMV